MIAVRLEGRLGNQLFQYAFIYSAAKKLQTKFYLDKSIENFLLEKYFEIKTDFIAPIDHTLFSLQGYKNFFCYHLKKRCYLFLHKAMLSQNTTIIGNYEAVDNNLKLLKNHTLYEGFFQSEDYFSDVEQDIRLLFQVKKPFVAVFEEIQKKINSPKKKVVIHVRRSDYVDLDWSLPLSYYKKAIESISVEDADYIFISDDPSFVEKEFSYIPNKYVSTHDEITDLQFLMNGDICILSNSSFSWWGAWLNKKASKKIIAPEFWLGFGKKKENPIGIIPPDWTLLSTYDE